MHWRSTSILSGSWSWVASFAGTLYLPEQLLILFGPFASLSLSAESPNSLLFDTFSNASLNCPNCFACHCLMNSWTCGFFIWNLFWNVELIAQEISVVWRLSGCRLGNVRAISRRYIADHVPVKELTRASAAFVTASALGMAAGPALAGLLNNINFKVKQNMFFNLLILSILLRVVEDLHYSHIQFNLFLLAKEGTTIMSWSWQSLEPSIQVYFKMSTF